jgi:PKD repeat protein
MHQYLTPGIYTVKLTATAATTGSGSTTQNITATGYLPLTISRNGSGAGTVTSVPAGIDCGAMCANLYLVATPIALTATPAAGSAFTGWSGACSGTGGCAVTMNHARSVTATFDALPAPVVNQPQTQTQTQTQTQGTTHPAGKCAALKGHKRSACITKKCGRLKPHSTKKRRKAYGRCRAAAVRKAS